MSVDCRHRRGTQSSEQQRSQPLQSVTGVLQPSLSPLASRQVLTDGSQRWNVIRTGIVPGWLPIAALIVAHFSVPVQLICTIS